MERPPIERWGVTADLIPLVGGHRNHAFRTTSLGMGKELVFKSTRRTEAAIRWLTEVHMAARVVGFVVPQQVEGSDGSLVQGGWTCERFLEGAHFSSSDVSSVLPLVAAFHVATAHLPQRPGFLSSKDLIGATHGGDVDLRDMPVDVVSRCRDAWRAVSNHSLSIVHGDLGPGNLINCPDGRTALIDWDECRRDLLLFDMAVLREADDQERRASRAWEVACSWKIEPGYARHVASRP